MGRYIYRFDLISCFNIHSNLWLMHHLSWTNDRLANNRLERKLVFSLGGGGGKSWSSALADINRASTQLIPFDGPIFARPSNFSQRLVEEWPRNF